ncbi:MAG: hypothetical protein PVH25_08610 [Burkholderiales bacterium]
MLIGAAVIIVYVLPPYIPVPTLIPCERDLAVSAGLLTAPPTDIDNIDSVIPLGNLNPGGMHVLSVDHMYLTYPRPLRGGLSSYPVHNMADGELFMLFRQQVPGRPDFDYQLFVEHSCSVHSYFDHLHGLSPAIDTHLTTHSAAWLDLGGSGSGPWLMFLGQRGGPPKLSLAAGDQLGITKDYSNAWDIGIVDTRYVNGVFANMAPNRYPTYSDYAPLFPVLSGVDLSIYNTGNKMFNGACFIDYMDSSTGLQSAWRAKLDSTTASCGIIGWDKPGKLRGAWFNPVLDALPTVVMDYEAAALSIIPLNRNSDQVQIGIGNAAGGSTTPSLALLDPSTWTPPVSAPQIANPFRVNMDRSLVAVVNPDPENIGPGTTVCYDLSHAGGYDTLLLRMADATHLDVKYDPATRSTPQCAALSASFPPVDATWKAYIR